MKIGKLLADRKVIYNIILIAIVVFFCLIILGQNKLLAKYRSTEIVLNKTIFKDSLEKELLKNEVFLHADLLPLVIDKNAILTNARETQVHFSKIFTGKKIVFHFSESNCMTCVEKHLPFLEALKEKIGRENVVIVGSYETSDYLFLTLKKYGLDFPVYNLKPKYLSQTLIEKLNTPYVFYIDSSLNIQDVFIPEKMLSKLSERYYQHILLKHFQ
jgi:hypothetical protein